MYCFTPGSAIIENINEIRCNSKYVTGWKPTELPQIKQSMIHLWKVFVQVYSLQIIVWVSLLSKQTIILLFGGESNKEKES